jgi:dienelactone hydrolase
MGDTLMRKVLQDAMAAVSALHSRADVIPGAVVALGHSYGGNTTLFLTAVDNRIRLGCASGALGSYQRKMSDGTGLEMAEVIPGFTTRFDIGHVLAAIAPRPFLVVSGTGDKYAPDARDLVDTALAANGGSDDGPTLAHLQTSGGHTLDTERFEAIVGWIIRAASHSKEAILKRLFAKSSGAESDQIVRARPNRMSYLGLFTAHIR